MTFPLAPVNLTSIKLLPNPDGSIRTNYPLGNFLPTLNTLQINPIAFAAALGPLSPLFTGATAINFNLQGSWLTGSQASSCTFALATLSGNSASAKNWAISGTNLTQSLVSGSIGAGVLAIYAVDSSGNRLLMGTFQWAIAAPTGGTDTLGPTVPDAIQALPTNGVSNSVTVSFDPSTDLTPSSGVPPSGVDHYNVRNSANAVIATVPAVASKLPGFTLYNLGPITSPAAPSMLQTNRQYALTAAGTGIHNTPTEQCGYWAVPISGAFQITAKINLFTGPNNFSTAGLMLHATAVQGGIFAAGYLQPAAGSQGIQLKARKTQGGNGTNQVSIPTDGAGSTLTGPVWIRCVRSGDLQTLTWSYSEDGESFVAFGTLTLPMPSQIFAGLFAASQTAGTAITVVIEEVSITSAPALLTTFSATVADTYTVEAVDAAGNSSGHLPGIFVTPTVVAPSTAIRLYPGFFPSNANFHFSLDANGTPDAVIQLNKYSQGGYTNIRGVMKNAYYAELDQGVGAANYAPGQSYVAKALATCKTNGQKFWLSLYDHNTFLGGSAGTVTSASPRVAPAWWIANGWVVGTANNTNGVAQDVIINLSSTTIVEGALKPLLKAYLDEFATDPNFAGIAFPVLETVVGNAPNYNRVQFYNNILTLCAWIRANYPTVTVRVNINFMIGGTDADVDAFFTALIAIGGVVVFSTDPILPAPGYTFAGTEANHRGIQANNVYCGYSNTGGNKIYTDRRGKLLVYCDTQYLGVGAVTLSHVQPSNLPDIFAQNMSIFGPCVLALGCYDQNSSGPNINQWNSGLGAWFLSSAAANYFANFKAPTDNFTYVVG